MRVSETGTAALAAAALAVLTWTYLRLGVGNTTIAALSYLTVILAVATVSTLRLAVVTSIAAMLSLNYFFFPPVRTFTITDPQNWVALFVFLAVSLVATNLSSAVRQRAAEAIHRRDEVARLFDLSRDVLLATDSREALPALAQQMARRFDLDYVGICLRTASGEWRVDTGGSRTIALSPADLDAAIQGAGNRLEFDARERTYAGQRVIGEGGANPVRLVPLRFGDKATGLLAASGRVIEPGTLDALAGITAIAIERAQFLDDRKVAELTRQREDLKSALLASFAHDLKTPLTAIRIAAGNLQAEWLSDTQRREQSELVLSEVERLTRLFEGILDMARIDAGAVATNREWVHPAEIVETARGQVEHQLADHPIEILDDATAVVYVDPRLTSSALARLLENAAAYSPPGAAVTVTTETSLEGLRISVRDRGPGIAPADLPQLFHRFFRGSAATGTPGTGMGLAIARGLLAAEDGRVWAENHPGGGALFTVMVAGPVRQIAQTEASPT
jgi:two-component system sensor histidine kinase KdpD